MAARNGNEYGDPPPPPLLFSSSPPLLHICTARFLFFAGLQWEGEKRNLDFLAVKTSREKSLVDPWGLFFYFFLRLRNSAPARPEPELEKRKEKRTFFLSREKRSSRIKLFHLRTSWGGGEGKRGRKNFFFPGKGKMLSSSLPPLLYTPAAQKGRGGGLGEEK